MTPVLFHCWDVNKVEFPSVGFVVLTTNFNTPDFLLWSVFHHQVYEDWPQVCAFGVAAEDFVKHGLGSLRVAILKLQPGKFGDQVHICKQREKGTYTVGVHSLFRQYSLRNDWCNCTLHYQPNVFAHHRSLPLTTDFINCRFSFGSIGKLLSEKL